MFTHLTLYLTYNLVKHICPNINELAKLISLALLQQSQYHYTGLHIAFYISQSYLMIL